MQQSTFISETFRYMINSKTVLFFDMDGTLIDTDLANNMAYLKAIESILGILSLPHQATYQRLNRTIIAKLLPNLDQSDLQQIILQKEFYYSKYLSYTKLIYNVANLLKEYSTTHKTVLITNSFEQRALSTLEYHGLTKYFDQIYCQTENNPAKNKYLLPISDMGIAPENIIVFENEHTEIAHAQAAGIPLANIFSPNNLNRYSYAPIYN